MALVGVGRSVRGVSRDDWSRDRRWWDMDGSRVLSCWGGVVHAMIGGAVARQSIDIAVRRLCIGIIVFY